MSDPYYYTRLLRKVAPRKYASVFRTYLLNIPTYCARALTDANQQPNVIATIVCSAVGAFRPGSRGSPVCARIALDRQPGGRKSGGGGTAKYAHCRIPVYHRHRACARARVTREVHRDRRCCGAASHLSNQNRTCANTTRM